MKFSVGTKIGAGFFVALLVLCLFAGITYMNTRAMVDAAAQRKHAYDVLQHLDRVAALLKDAETGQRGYIITGKEPYLGPYKQATQELPAEIKLLDDLVSKNGVQADRLRLLRGYIDQKLTELAQTIQLRGEKGFEAAAVVVNSDQGKIALDNALATLLQIRNGEEAELQRRTTEAEASTSTLYSTIEYGIVGAAILMVILGYITARNIAGPLGAVTAIANRIAEGNLTGEVQPIHRSDEVGVLHNAFARMNESLRLIAARASRIAMGDLHGESARRSEEDSLGIAFDQMTRNLREVIQEISEAVNVLASSASEIMASTSQLASGAAETAAAVTETTTTVEEVKQTSRVSSEKAQLVAGNAQQASKVAQGGRRSVDEVILGTNRIRQQMEAVAESIIRLSEQSQAIGEIIATVDDLASQSNLLAVNASIEAAKAGEYGRGFAVVAQEVRSMADQSRQATTQVRAILAQIQKATRGVVVATEQGSKAVEAGVAQSEAAGDSIRALSETISQSAQSAIQIAATSHEQFVGMDQVAMAMENIKVASSQTLASTKQAEGAAQGLHQLGQKLKELVSTFKV